MMPGEQGFGGVHGRFAPHAGKGQDDTASFQSSLTDEEALAAGRDDTLPEVLESSGFSPHREDQSDVTWLVGRRCVFLSRLGHFAHFPLGCFRDGLAHFLGSQYANPVLHKPWQGHARILRWQDENVKDS